MRARWLPIIVLALSVSCVAEQAPATIDLHNFTRIQTERAVVGSVADISARYELGTPITVIHILEFSTDIPLREPNLLQVRLCGDQSRRLGPSIHTNITLIYNLASPTRLPGCLPLISSDSWQDDNKPHTATINPTPVKRSKQRDKSMQDIVSRTSAD